MALPAQDNFNGTNYSYLNVRTGWLDTYGTSSLQIRNNGVTAELSGNYDAGAHAIVGDSWNGDTFYFEQYSQAVLTAALGYGGMGVLVRRQGGADSYYGLFILTGGAILFKRTAGSNTTLAYDEITRAVGSLLKLTVTGTTTTTLTAYYNSVQILTVNDSSSPFTSGSAGVCGIGDNGPNQLIDDWEGGDIGAAAGHPTMSRWQGIPGMKYTGRKGW